MSPEGSDDTDCVGGASSFTFVLWKANIAPPALPLPEKSHTRLGALLSRVQCWDWDQAHRWATGAQLGFTA